MSFHYTEEHQYDNSGNPIGTGTYYYTLAGKLIGVLLGTTMEFVLTDDLGSVRTAITNQAGAATVVGYVGYGPFGFLQYHAGQTVTNKGYTGQYNDPLSGLDYYVARYYDPVVGLFLSADTVQSNLRGFDPYAYVGNNPETLTDPTGHCDIWCGIVNNVLTVADSTFPPAGISADAWELAAQVHNGWQATSDQLAAARLTGTRWGLAAFPGVVAGFAGFACSPACIPFASVSFMVQINIGLVVAPFANDINQAGTNFYAHHPVETQITGASEAPPPPSVIPTVKTNRSNPLPTPSRPSPKPTGNSNPFPSAPDPSQSTRPSPSPRPNWTYYTIASGDTLWGIATMFYGSGLQWQRIYQANIGVIGSNPNLIYAGERLRILR